MSSNVCVLPYRPFKKYRLSKKSRPQSALSSFLSLSLSLFYCIFERIVVFFEQEDNAFAVNTRLPLFQFKMVKKPIHR